MRAETELWRALRAHRREQCAVTVILVVLGQKRSLFWNCCFCSHPQHKPSASSCPYQAQAGGCPHLPAWLLLLPPGGLAMGLAALLFNLLLFMTFRVMHNMSVSVFAFFHYLIIHGCALMPQTSAGGSSVHATTAHPLPASGCKFYCFVPCQAGFFPLLLVNSS